jgi:penicillin V acylase-like amidase (Ntn superfamily)
MEEAMCTRVLYETGNQTFITGRNMDWSDLEMETSLWSFPRGMNRAGGVGAGSLSWTSKHGSLILSAYNLVTSDGVNDAGLVGNLLYLAESDFGDPKIREKPTISVGAWLQFLLDSYANVTEAVEAMRSDPFTVVPASAPNGRPTNVHVALSDARGDSAIFEYLDGSLQIHHGRQYRVMTNSPVYDQQLAINTYWDQIGGRNFLPGSTNAPDRFVRASYALKSSPKFTDKRQAVASVLSQMRSVSVPLGMNDHEKQTATTLWRAVSDHGSKRYYFDSMINPSLVWLDFDAVDLDPGAKPMTVQVGVPEDVGGEISSKLEPAAPFTFLAP